MKIGVIGGGFTGLTAAYHLAKSGHRVTVFEKENHFGGLAWGFKKSGWDWTLEASYHHVFTGDHDILELVRELGIGKRIMKLRPITVTQHKDAYYPLDSPASLITFPGLSITDKLRTGLLISLLKINPFWKPLESYTAQEIFSNFGGISAWEILWKPLLVGKFGKLAPEISAAWLWARLKKRSSSLVYFEGGFQSVIDALLETNIRLGVVCLNNKSVNKIGDSGTAAEVSINGNTHQFDKVIFTGPTAIFAKIALQLPQSYLSPLLSIPHLHAQVLILETEQPILQSAYWLNVTDRSFPFLALVQHTNFVDKKYYGEKHISYIGNYLPDGHPLLKKTAPELLNIFMPYIKKINPGFDQRSTINEYLFTAPHAQPVHFRNYSKIAPKFQTPLPNFFLANMDSIFPWDRGTNYAVKLGKEAAEFISSK